MKNKEAARTARAGLPPMSRIIGVDNLLEHNSYLAIVDGASRDVS